MNRIGAQPFLFENAHPFFENAKVDWRVRKRGPDFLLTSNHRAALEFLFREFERPSATRRHPTRRLPARIGPVVAGCLEDPFRRVRSGQTLTTGGGSQVPSSASGSGQ